MQDQQSTISKAKVSSLVSMYDQNKSLKRPKDDFVPFSGMKQGPEKYRGSRIVATANLLAAQQQATASNEQVSKPRALGKENRTYSLEDVAYYEDAENLQEGQSLSCSSSLDSYVFQTHFKQRQQGALGQPTTLSASLQQKTKEELVAKSVPTFCSPERAPLSPLTLNTNQLDTSYHSSRKSPKRLSLTTSKPRPKKAEGTVPKVDEKCCPVTVPAEQTRSTLPKFVDEPESEDECTCHPGPGSKCICPHVHKKRKTFSFKQHSVEASSVQAVSQVTVNTVASDSTTCSKYETSVPLKSIPTQPVPTIVQRPAGSGWRGDMSLNADPVPTMCFGLYEKVTSAAATPDGCFVACGFVSGAVRLYDMTPSGNADRMDRMGCLLGCLKKTMNVDLRTNTVIAGGGSHLFVGAGLGSHALKVWDLDHFRRLRETRGFAAPHGVRYFECDDTKSRGLADAALISSQPNGSKRYRVLCGIGFGKMNIYDVVIELSDLSGGVESHVWSLIFSESAGGPQLQTGMLTNCGQQAVTRTTSGLRVWDLSTPWVKPTKWSKIPNTEQALAVCAAESQLVKVYYDSSGFLGQLSVDVSNPPSGTVLSYASISCNELGRDVIGCDSVKRRGGSVQSIAATEDGSHVVVTCSDGNSYLAYPDKDKTAVAKFFTLHSNETELFIKLQNIKPPVLAQKIVIMITAVMDNEAEAMETSVTGVEMDETVPEHRGILKVSRLAQTSLAGLRFGIAKSDVLTMADCSCFSLGSFSEDSCWACGDKYTQHWERDSFGLSKTSMLSNDAALQTNTPAVPKKRKLTKPGPRSNNAKSPSDEGPDSAEGQSDVYQQLLAVEKERDQIQQSFNEAMQRTDRRFEEERRLRKQWNVQRASYEKRIEELTKENNALLSQQQKANEDYQHLVSGGHSSQNSEEIAKVKHTLLNALSQCIAYEEQCRKQTSTVVGGSECKCLICLMPIADMLMSPCGHICLCEIDASQLKASGQLKKCPYCQQDVQTVIKIRKVG